MPIVKFDTGFNIEVELPVASFWKRFIAWTIDMIIIWLITWGLAKAFYVDTGFGLSRYGSIAGLLISLPSLFYHLLFETLFNGRSPGKMLMKLKVITEEGGQPALSQYLIRWAFRGLDLPLWLIGSIGPAGLPFWTILLLFAGLITVLATPKSQRIGDVVAGTIVIDTSVKTSWQDTIFTEISDSYKPKYPGVMKLTDRDINTLKSIIETVKKNNDHDLARRIAERISSKADIQTDEYPIDFLERLLLDYNYYSTR